VIGYVAVWISKANPIGIQRRSQRAPGVARRGRDEYTLET
jgi:hypothetical protein